MTVTGWKGCFVPGGRAELPAFCPSQSGSEEPFPAVGCRSLCLACPGRCRLGSVQQVAGDIIRLQGQRAVGGSREAPAGGDCCSPHDQRLRVASIQALFVLRWFFSWCIPQAGSGFLLANFRGPQPACAALWLGDRGGTSIHARRNPSPTNVKGLILTTRSPGEAKGEFWGLGVPSAPVLVLSGVFHVSTWWRKRRRMKGSPGHGQGGGEPHAPAISG